MLKRLTLLSGLLATSLAQAATINVTSSLDTNGVTAFCSLRAALTAINAASLAGTGCANTGAAFGTGDTITFAPAVGTVTLLDLANNQLVVSVPSLVIQGGTGVVVERLTSYANAFRLINHTGNGTLTLQGLSLRNGLTNTTNERGGGVRSAGNLDLQNSRLRTNSTNCSGCGGGGAHADGTISLSNSLVDVNSTLGANSPGGGLSSFASVGLSNSELLVNTTAGTGSFGGGVYAGNGLGTAVSLISSLVRNNETTAANSQGGGVYSNGAMTVAKSFFSGNQTQDAGGGAYVGSGAASVDSSTFYNNFALGGQPKGGGLYLAASAANHSLTNSTLSHNRADSTTPNAGCGGAIWVSQQLTLRNSTLGNNATTGLGGAICFNANGASLSINSSIVANSTASSAASANATVDIFNNVGVMAATGANNLIQSLQNVTAPAGTLSTDPLLGTLANNGCFAPAGSSFAVSPAICPPTRLLGAGSPALNAGNNAAGLANEQRGSGYARVQGAAADMGAVEMPAGVVLGPWAVSTAVTPVGSGQLSCTPNPVPNGQSSTCTATPIGNMVFVGFSGDCSGATCTLSNVTAARSVTATFQPLSTSQAVPGLSLWALLLLIGSVIGLLPRRW
jgi:Divergent InlB B-repeat domain